MEAPKKEEVMTVEKLVIGLKELIKSVKIRASVDINEITIKIGLPNGPNNSKSD